YRRCRLAFFQGRHWINWNPTIRHHEVKMRAGCQARLTDETYKIALLYRLSGAHALCNARKMSVSAGHSVHVADLHQVAVAVVPACKCDRAIRNGEDGTALGCGVIRRKVRAIETEDRMFAAVRKS